MENLKAKTDLMGIVITDTKDEALLTRLNQFSENRLQRV